MAPNSTLRKMRKKQLLEINRLEADLEKARKKLEAIDLLGEEEPSDLPKGQLPLSKPTQEQQKSSGKRQQGASKNIMETIEHFPPQFLFKDVKKDLSSRGYSYPTSTK